MNRRAIGVGLLVAAVAVSSAAFVVRRSERESAISTTIQWARLAPLPASAHAVSIETSGNAFSRSFDLSFEAPASEIQSWLARSPGTAGKIAQPVASGAVTYAIEPGGGAQAARIVVDYVKRRVSVHVVWS